MRRARFGEQFFDETFVLRVRELIVAAQGVGLVEALWVVGVVAVGRAAAADDELLDVVCDAGFENVPRAEDVHLVREAGAAVLGNGEQKRKVDDGVDLMFRDEFRHGVASHVSGLVAYVRKSLRGGYGSYVEGDQFTELVAPLRQRRDDDAAQVAGGAGYEDARLARLARRAHPAGS